MAEFDPIKFLNQKKGQDNKFDPEKFLNEKKGAKQELPTVELTKEESLGDLNAQIGSIDQELKDFSAATKAYNDSRNAYNIPGEVPMVNTDQQNLTKQNLDKYKGFNEEEKRKQLSELGRKRDEYVTKNIQPIIDGLEATKSKLTEQINSIPLPKGMESFGMRQAVKGNPAEEQNIQTYIGAVNPLKERLNSLNIAIKYAKNTKDLANVSPDKYLKALGQGFAQQDWLDLVTFGMKSMNENFKIADISRKQMLGVATQEEIAALQLYDQFKQLASTKDTPVTYDIAQSFVQSLPYMAEIALTGGARGAVTKYLSKSVGKGALKVAGGASKYITKPIIAAAGAVVTSPLQPMTYKTLSERQLANYIPEYDEQGNIRVREASDKENALESLFKSLGETAISVFAEQSGVMFDEALPTIGKWFGYNRVKPNIQNKISQAIGGIKKATMVNGWGGEVGEEYVEKFLDTLIFDPRADDPNQDKWKDFFNSREFLTILGSTFLTQAMFKTQYIPHYMDVAKAKDNLNSSEQALPNDIRENLVNAMSGTVNEQVDALRALNLGDIENPTYRSAIVNYIKDKVNYDFLKGVKHGETELAEVNKVDGIVNTITHPETGAVISATDKLGNTVFVVGGNLDEDIVAVVRDGQRVMESPKNLTIKSKATPDEIRNDLILQSLSVLNDQQKQEDAREQMEKIGGSPESIPNTGDEFQIPNGLLGKVVDVDNTGIIFDTFDELGNMQGTSKVTLEEYNAMMNQENTQTGQEQIQPQLSEQQDIKEVDQQPEGTIKAQQGHDKGTNIKTLTDGKVNLNIQLNENNEGISQEVYDNLPDAEKVVKSLSKRFSKLEFKVIDQSDNDPFTPDAFVISVKPKSHKNLVNTGVVETPSHNNHINNEQDLQGQQVQSENQKQQETETTEVQPEQVQEHGELTNETTNQNTISSEESKPTEASVDQVGEQAEETEEVIPVNESTIDQLNQEEIKFLEERLNDPNEQQDQKEWWSEDIEDLKTNPKKYWDAFVITDNSVREQQIKAIQDYYNKSTEKDYTKLDEAINNLVSTYGNPWHNGYIESVQLPYFTTDHSPDESIPKNFTLDEIIDRYRYLSNQNQEKPIIPDIDAHIAEVDKKAEIQKEEKEVDPNPTDAQVEAGNAKKGHIKLRGHEITIENAKGSIRKSKPNSPKKWKIKMNNTYGYFRRTEGKDGDQVDVFIGPNPETGKIFVIDQIDPKTGVFDEHKVMFGFGSEKEAKEAYLSNYKKGWKGFGAITEIRPEDFKQWLGDGKRTKQAVAYKPKEQQKGKKLSAIEKEALNIDVTGWAIGDVFRYFILGGKINTSAIQELYGTKGKENDATNKKIVQKERNARFTIVSNNGKSIDQLAHDLWEQRKNDKFNDIDYRDAVINVIHGYTSTVQMAKEIVDKGKLDQQGGLSDEQLAEMVEIEKQRQLHDEQLIDEALEQIYQEYPELTDEQIGEFWLEIINFEQTNEDGKAQGNQGAVQDEVESQDQGDSPKGEPDRTGSDEGVTETPKSKEEQSYQERISQLTQTQQAEVKSLAQSLDDKIQKGITSVRNAESEYNREKNSIEKQRVSQGDLFSQPKEEKFAGQLFETPKDFSGDNMQRILKPKKDLLDKQRSELNDLYKQRDKIVNDYINAVKSQKELVIPNTDQPVSVETDKKSEVDTPTLEQTKELSENTKELIEKSIINWFNENPNDFLPINASVITQYYNDYGVKNVLKFIDSINGIIRDDINGNGVYRYNQEQPKKEPWEMNKNEYSRYIITKAIGEIQEFIKRHPDSEHFNRPANYKPSLRSKENGAAEKTLELMQKALQEFDNTGRISYETRVALKDRISSDLIDYVNTPTPIKQNIYSGNRKFYIQNALKEGKQIPEEALKDYPEPKEQPKESDKSIQDQIEDTKRNISNLEYRLSQKNQPTQEKNFKELLEKERERLKELEGKLSQEPIEQNEEPLNEDSYSPNHSIGDVVEIPELQEGFGTSVKNYFVDESIDYPKSSIHFREVVLKNGEKWLFINESKWSNNEEPIKFELTEKPQDTSVKERIEKQAAEANIKEIQDKGFIRVSDPQAVAEKIKKYTGVDVVVDESTLSLKKEKSEFIGDILNDNNKEKQEEVTPETITTESELDVIDKVNEPEQSEDDNDVIDDNEGATTLEKLQDFGEKIGAARKDTAEPRGKMAPNETPGWARKFKVVQDMKTKLWSIIIPQGSWFRTLKGGFSTSDEALEFLPIAAVAMNHRVYSVKDGSYSIFRKWSSGKQWEVKGGFPSYDEAMKYMAKNAVDIINKKSPIISRPHLDSISRKRKDWRNGKNTTPQQFLDTFGFRGGEFGNWLAADERQTVLNMAYDAFMDLSEILGIPPKAVGLKGELSIGFGSRGHGLQKASAHYEPNRAVINLTRINGAGALAHEWFHALDNYLAKLDGKSSSQRQEDGTFKREDRKYAYFSHGESTYPKTKMRDELLKAFNAVMSEINTREVVKDYDIPKLEKLAQLAKDDFLNTIKQIRDTGWYAITKQREYGAKKKPATPEQLKKFDDLVNEILNGNYGEDKWHGSDKSLYKGKWMYDREKELSDLIKEITGKAPHSGTSSDNRGFLYSTINRIKRSEAEVLKAKENSQYQTRIKSEFLRESLEMDQSRSGSYWSSPHEMAARSFEAFLEDEVMKQGETQYLVYGANNTFYRLFGVKPYPEGQERVNINEAFRKFFDTINTKENEKGDIIMYRKKEPFYSNTENALESLSDNPRTPQQWKAELLKNGSKEAELRWMGFDQFVDGKKTLTKSELTEFVNSNKVQVEEVVKTQSETFGRYDALKLLDQGLPVYGISDNGHEGLIENLNDLDRYSLFATDEGLAKSEAKYSQYKTQGGQNYKEVLLTTPNKNPETYGKYIDEMRSKYGRDWHNAMSESEQKIHDELRDKSQYEKGFQSSHFDEPNIAVHLRTSEFITKDGKRILLVEEVQSDWAQKGKKEGFGNEYELSELNKQLEKAREEYNKLDFHNLKLSEIWETPQAQEVSRLEELVKNQGKTVPDMPFKQTDQWVGLGMKWAIRHAAENGFDGVAWTKGEQQAERYDLSNVIESIKVEKGSGKKSWKYRLFNKYKTGQETTVLVSTDEELEHNVGKDLASKILNEVTETFQEKEYTGLDLQVGGEGMRAFYDQIIPSWVNKYAKKFGTRTTTTEIDTTPNVIEQGIDLETGLVGQEKKYLQVHYLPISDLMVQSVIQGQPMFRFSFDLFGTKREKKYLSVKSVVDKLTKDSKGAITATVVRTEKELLDQLKSEGYNQATIENVKKEVKEFIIPGVYLNGKSYIVSDNIHSSEEAFRTVIHEQGLHRGIKILIPDESDREKLLLGVWNTIGSEGFERMLKENKLNPKIYKNLSDADKAEEYLAFLAEKIIKKEDLTPKERSVWEWLKHYVNRLIEKVLRLTPNSIKFTDRELSLIVRASVAANHEQIDTDTKETGRAEEATPENNREGVWKSSLLSGDNTHPISQGDHIEYPNSGRSSVIRYIKYALGKTELKDLPYNHGTYVSFDRFDFDKIPEDRGEKVHAYGLYFNITTIDKEVGISYARMNTRFTPKGSKYLDDVKIEFGAIGASYISKSLLKNKGKETKENILKTLNEYKTNANFSNNIDILNRLIPWVESNEFPDDRILVSGFIRTQNKELNLIDWHNPLLKEQWDTILNRLRIEQFNENELIERIGDMSYLYNDNAYRDPVGGDVYRALSEVVGSDIVASKLLLRAGIDGTIYFDNTINDGKERVNVCLFSDKVQFRKTGFAGELLEEKEISDETKLTNYEKAQELVQDRMYSVRKLMDIVKKRGGVIDDFSNPYIQENLAASRADAAMDKFRSKQLKNILDIIGEVIKETGASYQEIIDYMIAKHTPERNKYFKDQGRKGEKFAGELSDEQAEEIIKAFEMRMGENLTFRLWDAIRSATRFTLDKYYDYGFIDKDTYIKLKAQYQFYIPLRGWDVDIDSIWDYTNSEAEGALNLMKSAKGRKTKADNPLAHIISMAHSAVVAGEKNKIRQATVRLVSNNRDMKDLFTFKQSYFVNVGKDEDGEVIWEERYERPEQKLWDEDKVKRKSDMRHLSYRSRSKSSQHEVVAWINGEKITAVFHDPNISNAINYNNQFWPETTRNIQSTIGVFTRWLSSNFTAKNPAFIPINLLRDLGYASMSHAIREDGNFKLYIKNLPRAKKAISKYLKGKSDPNNELDHLYTKFLEHGGETGWVHLDGINTIKKQLLKDIKRVSETKGFARRVVVDRLIKNSGIWLEHMAITSENISRFATFLASVESGKTYTKAAYDAKKVTVNFNRKGRVSGLLGGLFAFFNASVQGGNNILNLAAENKKKFAFVSVAFFGLGLMVAALHDAFEDDDEENYFDNSKYTRSNFLTISVGGGNYITLPLPHGFRGFYGLGEQAYSFIKGKINGDELVKDGLSNMIGNLSPVDPISIFDDKEGLSWRPLIPTAFVPAYDISVNMDYSGRPIYSEPFTAKLEKTMASSQQYRKSVNPLIKSIYDSWFELGGGDPDTKLKYTYDKGLKEVNYWMDWNPSMGEHALTYYLGGRGKFWNDLYTLSAGIIDETKQVISEDKSVQNAVKSLDFNTVPVISRLFREPYSYEYQKEYSKLRQEVEIYKSLESVYRKNRDFEARKELMNEKRKMMIVNMTEDRLDKIYDMATRPNLTKDKYEELVEKADQLKKKAVLDIEKLKP